MSDLDLGKLVLEQHQIVIDRFVEKAEMIAATATTIFNKNGEHNKLIGIILIHQAAELALKSNCLANEKPIFEKNTSITFLEALQRIGRVLSYQETTIMRILNKKRNDVQHLALFDTSDEKELEGIVFGSLVIIVKLLKLIGYDPTEILTILEAHPKSAIKFRNS